MYFLEVSDIKDYLFFNIDNLLKYFIYLILERGKGRKRGRKNIDM